MIDIDLNDVPEIIARKNERGISFKIAALEINAEKRATVDECKQYEYERLKIEQGWADCPERMGR